MGPHPLPGPPRSPPPLPPAPAWLFSSALDEVKINPLRGEAQAFKLDWHADVEQLVAGARGPGEQVFAGGDVSFISLLVADKEAAVLP